MVRIHVIIDPIIRFFLYDMIKFVKWCIHLEIRINKSKSQSLFRPIHDFE